MIAPPPQAASDRGRRSRSTTPSRPSCAKPAYTTPIRQSILGRILETVFRWVRDLLEQLGGLPDARYVLIAAVALIVIVIAGRIVIGQQMEARRRAGAGLRAIDGERRDYWALAAELDAAGNYVGACHAIYIGVLDALARTGAVKLPRVEDERRLRARSQATPLAVADEFASFARQFDRSVYRWSAPTHDE